MPKYTVVTAGHRSATRQQQLMRDVETAQTRDELNTLVAAFFADGGVDVQIYQELSDDPGRDHHVTLHYRRGDREPIVIEVGRETNP